MRKEDYTFVTIDNDDVTWDDAVVIDVDGEEGILDAVTIDESSDQSDFIMLSDDTVMLSDADMVDISSIDMDIDSADFSIIL